MQCDLYLSERKHGVDDAITTSTGHGSIRLHANYGSLILIQFIFGDSQTPSEDVFGSLACIKSNKIR